MTRACEVALRAANTLFFAGERLSGCAIDALAPDAAAITVRVEDPLTGRLEGLVGEMQSILVPGDIAFCPGDPDALTVEKTGLATKIETFEWPAAYRSWGGSADLRTDLSERCIVLLIRNGGILDPALFRQKLQQCAFLKAALIPASLSSPAALEVRVALHRETLNRLVQAPKAQWMHEGELIGLVEAPSQRKRLSLNRFGADGQDDTVNLDFAQTYEAVGISPTDSYGVKNVTRYQFEVVAISPWTKDRLMAAVAGAPTAAHQLMAECFQREIDEEKSRTARALQDRLQALQTRPRIRDESGAEIGIVPSNEHETVVLAERLSARVARGFHGEFRLLEYTSLQGIDAVVRTKLDAARPVENVLTEFEHALRNFFQHRHHPEQVGLIVCWSDGDIAEGTYAYGEALGSGPLEFRINRRGWRRMLQFSTTVAHLVVLSRLPGLTIQ